MILFRSLTTACFGLLAGSVPLAAATLTVTTADNGSPANDGQLSLKEAIEQVQNGDTIAFDIPGAGPHYLVTPAEGYPLLQKTGVTIDGYSQPGAQRNTSPLTQPHTTVLKIVIDSREGGRFSLADYGSNGFGDSESAIFPLLFAANTRIQGLAFIGVPGDDNSESPFIYSIALIGASTDVRVQGCWFGLDPGAAPFPVDNDGRTTGVYGARSAVASFKWDDATTSEGLIIGTNGDGVDDRGEFNVMVGNLLAIHLETPNTRVSGNYINILPDGRVWDQSIEQIPLPSGDYECFENGRGHDNIIGTNGDGVSDEDEGNVIGPVQYDVYFEFWRTAFNVTFAGNRIGSGPRGETEFLSPPGTELAVMRSNSSVRIGSDLDGVGDAAEANHFSGFQGDFFAFHGSNNDASGKPTRISMRGNVLSGNYGDVPVTAQHPNITLERFYVDVLADPLNDYRPVLDASSTATAIKGRVPAAVEVTAPDTLVVDVDFYLADPWGLLQTDGTYPDGFPQGLVYLATRRLDGPQDTDPAAGVFSFAGLPGLTAESMNRLVCTAHYTGTGTNEFQSTTMFSLPPTGAAMSLSVVAGEGRSLAMSWLGGTGPFLIQHSASLGSGAWNDLVTTSNRSLTLPMAGPAGYFRVQDRTTKSVRLYTATLSGAAERPTPVVTTGTGRGYLSIEASAQKGYYHVAYDALQGDATDAHIHGPADANAFAGVLVGLTSPTGRAGVITGALNVLSADLINAANAGNTYFNIHSLFAGGGEIRGQITPFAP
jgi:hypothetical protein